MSELVTSPQNPHLKLVRKLQRRRAREHEGLFVVEGEDLVLAGLETGARARVLLVDGDRVPDLEAGMVPCPVVHVQPQLLASVSELAHAPRVIGVFERAAEPVLADALDASSRGPWLVLDAVADPGNVGTLVRAAAALGAGGIAVLPGSADPWSGKALRASMGAIFRLPLVRTDAGALEAVLAGDDVTCLVLDADGSVELADAPIDERTLVVIGSERDGVSQAVRALAASTARIPQDPDVESVNAGVAGSLALYEWRRRR